ncbi:MAG: LamG-like jellyroll fold domain-containing protein [Planctomycetota bacterium]
MFELQSGIAQLEFFCGATLVVEGPAKLELLSEKAVHCLTGKLQANVPPAARGFEVHVADSKVVDLGTEFGIEVSSSGVDLHVYDGEVELQHPSDESPKLLESGDSVTWSGVQSPTPDSPESAVKREKLVDVENFRRQAEGQSSRSYREWLDFSQRIASDSRLIAYYGMHSENRWERKLLDSRSPSDKELTGAIVGAEFSQGRWPEKNALEFKHPGDRVRVQIPGQFSSLSFCCWVRIDSLDRWYNSLFLTDNYQRGEPHWQILDSGQLFFSVRVSQTQGGQEHKVVLSPVFWKPSMSGQWLHLATTYDVENATTTHYLNGQPLSSEKIPAKQLVPETRIGLASIGNWSAPTRDTEEFAIRNLNGRMDEIMVFSAALSATEINEIYQHGKP